MNAWPVVGHRLAVRQLQLSVAQGSVPHALLFTGPESVGKMTVARILAQAMFCMATQEQPCGLCRACRKVSAGRHPDLLIVEPEGPRERLKIEVIRAVEQFLSLTPHESFCKVVIIANFDRATLGAANALLKTLEEPPAYAHIVLLAEDAELLLPTIVSRTNHIPLRPLSVPLVEKALRERWHVAPDQAERLARISGGRLGWAVRAVNDPVYLEQMEIALTQWLSLGAVDLPAQFALAEELAQSTAIAEATLAYWLLGWRDVLLLKTQATSSLMFRDYRAALELRANRVTVPQVVSLIERLHAAQASLQHHINVRLLLESLVLAHHHTLQR